MTTRLFFLLMLPVYLSASLPATIDFYNGNLSKAKEKANQEGKLYFVQFTASWCEPCRWMDEVTYKDPSVIAYINDNYIPVKVDIDDFDGFAYKQKYNISMLPSVLVFSSKGELLHKYEESLPPPTMLKILKLHDVPANRSTPQSFTQTESSQDASPATKPKESISRPALKPSIIKPAVIEEEIDEDVYMEGTEDIMDEDVEEIEEGEGLYKFKDAKYLSEGFSVQIGVYSEYENVLEKAAKVKGKFDDQMIVHTGSSNNKTVYKIMIGEFSNREEAARFQKQIEAKGFKGIVKDLSLMN